MLAKELRIPRGTRLVSPKSSRHPLFLIRFAPNQLQYSRFSFIISKKIDKRAVARNRMRRLLHQYIQERTTTFQPGWDILFLVQRPFAILTQDDKDSITTIFRQHQLISATVIA